MAIGDIQINALPDASLPLRMEDLFHLKEGIIDKKCTLESILAPHADRRDNPHGTTAADVNLGNVINAAQLLRSENLADVPDKAKARANLGITTSGEIAIMINAHANRKDNPHETTKVHVGLSNVTNDAQLKIASNLSDLNNINTARSNLSVYSIAQVDALINSHVNNRNNPHETTKVHVGLSNVNNWGASSDPNLNSTTTYATSAAVNAVLTALNNRTPIGHILITMSPLNPSTMGYPGVWVHFAQGRTLISEAGQTVGTTVGSASVALNQSNIPNYNMAFSALTSQSGEHVHAIATSDRDDQGYGIPDAPDQNTYKGAYTSAAGLHNHVVTGAVNSAGGGQAFSVIQPSIYVFMWQRVS